MTARDVRPSPAWPAALLAAGLGGCGVGTLPSGWSDALETCVAEPIAASARENGLSLAFEPCGANTLRGTAWSPDGQRLLFGTADGWYLLDGGRHTVAPVAGVSGARSCAWVGRRVACAVDRTLILTDGSTLSRHSLPFAPDGIAGAPEDTAWYWTKSDVRRFDPVVDASFPALGWTPAGPVRPAFEAGLVAVQEGDAVAVRRIDDGSEVRRYAHARDGRISADGRWVLLAADGPTVSVYDPVPLDGKDEGPKPGIPDERVTVPALDVAALDGRRWRLTAIQATDAEWYATPGWISLKLWGFDGRHVRANVGLLDLGPRLQKAERGERVEGIERIE